MANLRHIDEKESELIRRHAGEQAWLEVKFNNEKVALLQKQQKELDDLHRVVAVAPVPSQGVP